MIKNIYAICLKYILHNKKTKWAFREFVWIKWYFRILIPAADENVLKYND